MTALSSGRWVACYAPYNNFDPDVAVDRGQIVLMRSDDEGRAWSHTSMLRFEEAESSGVEAWVIELAGGRLLGTSWHMSTHDSSDYPCADAVSSDQGDRWSPTLSTGIASQTAALTALSNSGALFLYCQRKADAVSIGMPYIDPSGDDFGVKHNELIWRAQRVRRSDGEADH